MIRNSAAGSPARTYAGYWGDVYRAGRLDSGSTAVAFGRNSAQLTTGDGTTYRMTGFVDRGDGLVTWTARPGGPLGPRIAAARATARAGGLRVVGLRQYVNSESDLRVSLRIRNTAGSRRDLQTPAYTSPDGRSSTATVGAQGRTGVIPIRADTRAVALVSVASADLGGQLTLRVYDRAGSAQGSATLRLSRE